MKDSTNNKATYILGISAFFHDSAAALIKDGKIIAAVQEERFTRIKHDSSFPKNAINCCLKIAGIEARDLNSVVYFEKPLIKFERILETVLEFFPTSFQNFIDGMPAWLNKKLFIPKVIDKFFDNKLTCPIYFTTHHEAHAASAFFPSPFEKAAFICLDAVGEWDTTSWGIGDKNKLYFKQKLEFPHSLGMLYSAFTGFLGFKVNSGEYKVMGLAPYGEAKYCDLILDKMLKLNDDGSFKLNMDYFGYCNSKYMFNKNFEKLFKIKPRKPETELLEVHMDIASSIQKVTEKIVLNIANYVASETKLKNLCLAGGCALNCVVNGKIIKNTPFENVWVQPASGDAGGALGAALSIWYQKLNNERIIQNPDFQEGSLLGNEFSQKEINEYLDEIKAKYVLLEPSDLEKTVAKYIADGKIVGHYSGRMEFGPRALGNRSILADPRNVDMQKKLNLAIKKRESFRPFAPSCLEEDLNEIFDLEHNLKSPYMLITAPVKDSIKIPLTEEQKGFKGLKRLKANYSKLPAITHVDYSARIQTVSKKINERYWNIINEFKKLTGFGVIVNTSFNVRGEPLVNTPDNAYKCFMFSEMDVLVLNNAVLLKEEQPAIEGGEGYLSQFKLD